MTAEDMTQAMETDCTDRLAAYKKYLSSFKKASIPEMAAHFGESEEKILNELEGHIVSGELSYRINGVEGYIERYEPDAVNELIQDVIREGGLLVQTIHKKVLAIRSEMKELEDYKPNKTIDILKKEEEDDDGDK